MKVTIRTMVVSNINDLVRITLLAFEPIFQSFEQILGPTIYPLIDPDWRHLQQNGVESIC